MRKKTSVLVVLRLEKKKSYRIKQSRKSGNKKKGKRLIRLEITFFLANTRTITRTHLFFPLIFDEWRKAFPDYVASINHFAIREFHLASFYLQSTIFPHSTTTAYTCYWAGVLFFTPLNRYVYADNKKGKAARGIFTSFWNKRTKKNFYNGQFPAVILLPYCKIFLKYTAPLPHFNPRFFFSSIVLGSVLLNFHI